MQVKPRCILLYALAPEHVKPNEANLVINAIAADPTLPLAVYHDHFIGQAGGIILFFAENGAEREALQAIPSLAGWQVAVHPLIFSRSPAAFDEQIAFTLRRYRQRDWEILQREQRPVYGDPAREAQTAQEDE